MYNILWHSIRLGFIYKEKENSSAIILDEILFSSSVFLIHIVRR